MQSRHPFSYYTSKPVPLWEPSCQSCSAFKRDSASSWGRHTYALPYCLVELKPWKPNATPRGLAWASLPSRLTPANNLITSQTQLGDQCQGPSSAHLNKNLRLNSQAPVSHYTQEKRDNVHAYTRRKPAMWWILKPPSFLIQSESVASEASLIKLKILRIQFLKKCCGSSHRII